MYSRIKASAFMYVIGISLLIGFLIGGMVLYFSYQSIYREQLSISKKILSNVESAIQLMCIDESVGQTETWIDLYDKGRDSVRVKKYNWGLYDIMIAEGKFKSQSEKKVVLTGYGLPPDEQAALYVADLDKVVTVAGKTDITGHCYLPKTGIKPGIIEGSFYTGGKIVNGEIKKSLAQVPPLQASWLDKLGDLVQRQFPFETEKALMPLDSLKQTFDHKTLWIENQGTITLENVTLSGNIVVTSTKKIVLSPTAHLHDILIIAPYIIVEEGFVGNAHLMARDSIVTEKKVDLKFPSSIAVINPSLKDQAPYIFIGDDNRFGGVAFVWQKTYDIRYQPKLFLGKNVKIKGQLYSNGYLSLNQSYIAGSVYAYKLLLSTGSSTYENALLNTTIHLNKLPPGFAGLHFDSPHSMSYMAKCIE